MFPLCNTILLRGVRTRAPMKDTMLFKEVFELSGGVLTAIIRLKLFNASGKLFFD